MKPIVVKTALLLVLNVIIASNLAIAQFEQKFTLQFAGGYVKSISPEYFTEVFEDGFSVDAGAQYNFSRSTSLVVLVKYSKYFANEDTFLGGLEAYYNLLGISLCPKFRFNPDKRVNPYIFGGVSINYVSFTLGGTSFQNDSPASFGVTGGIGLDFRITDNFALFWQAGANTIKPQRDWFSAFYTQVGINISILKSKSL